MARFHCSDCDVSRKIPDSYIGRKVRCPGCGAVLRVLADPQDAPERTAPGGDADSQIGEPMNTTSGKNSEARFHCSHCGHEQAVPWKLVGRRARCPRCGEAGKVEGMDADGAEAGQQDAHPLPEEWEHTLADELAEDLAEDVPESAGGHRTAPAGGTERAWESGPVDADVLASSEKAESVPWRRSLSNGLALGLSAVLFALALAWVPAGGAGRPEWYGALVPLALTGALFGSLVYALRSQASFATGGPDVAAAAGLFILAQQVVEATGHLAPSDVLATLVAAVLVTAVCAGLLCLLLARFQEADWMRFVPFPVVGGVLAGAGVLLLQAAYQARTGRELTWNIFLPFMRGDFGNWADGASWWLPSAVLGLLLLIAFRRVRGIWWTVSPLAVGMVWCAFAPADWSGAWPGLQCGVPESSAAQALLDMHSTAFLSAVSWGELMRLSGTIWAVALLVAVHAAHKTLVLEEHLGRELSPGTELRALGASNLLSGLAVGFPVSLSLGRSLGNLRSGGSGPVAALVAALVCGAALLWADPLLQVIPDALGVGVLIFCGLHLLKVWLVDSVVGDLRPEEYACLLLAFVVTLAAGFALGVVTGTLLALILGLSRHSSASAIKQVMSGDAHRSNVDRSIAEVEALHELGQGVFILRLRGYLSGGALSAVLRALCERLEEPGRMPMRYAVLDFTSIKGVGSGLTRVFGGLARLGRNRNIRMVLTNVPFVLESRLEKAGLVGEDTTGFEMFRNLDYALEWCEDRLLQEAGVVEPGDDSLEALFAPVFPDSNAMHHLKRILQRQEVRASEYVFRQGDVSDSMYFVQQGRLTVELEAEGGKTMRLRKLGPGSVFGEMGIYTNAPRSASVRANEPAVVYRLSRRRLSMLQEKLPPLATSLDRFLVNLLARRVAHADLMVRDLMR
jgi:SulP family sulfate permease